MRSRSRRRVQIEEGYGFSEDDRLDETHQRKRTVFFHLLVECR